eukprot:8106327-Pyramimonas_sp.AAC.1
MGKTNHEPLKGSDIGPGGKLQANLRNAAAAEMLELKCSKGGATSRRRQVRGPPRRPSRRQPAPCRPTSRFGRSRRIPGTCSRPPRTSRRPRSAG